MKLIVAAGGTGGHIFPGLAIREEFLARSENNQVLFIGAVGGMEEELLKEEKIDAKFVRSGKFSGMTVTEKIQGLVSTFFGVFDSIKIIRQYMPDFVLGAGGYVSVPVLIAAWLLKVPRAIQEQNSYPGLSNRVLARISSRVFLSFESAEKYFQKVSRDKFLVCGNPLRRKVLDQLAVPPEVKNGNGNGRPMRFQIFVVGGSQGARKLNQLMIEGSEFLPPIRDHIKIVHMSGSIDQYDLIIAYSKAGIKAKVMRFVEDMGRELRDADLVISRAGAGAVFEMAAAQKPSILIPFPFAADDHQRVNAEYLSGEGSAMVFDEKAIGAKQLAETIIDLYQHPEKLKEMSAKAGSVARPNAAKDIVDEILRVAGVNR
jgi:UDP-N-acetylglucosamine--N-acetylmuramyl-(pentapeptide) pyrophosphoryl-undecaprenol N-acetylglucosamine transferase